MDCREGQASRARIIHYHFVKLMAFELQPTLSGNLVVLRPLRPDDWADLFAVASDPLVWELHPNNDRYQEDVFREFFRGTLESGGALAVLDAKDGRIIGSSRYAFYDEAGSEIEVGWTFLARRYWGGVYNGEMKRLMLDHAFRFVRQRRVLRRPQQPPLPESAGQDRRRPPRHPS
jgi:RimJ/RimL family protein N-acetyltransferase